MSPAEPADLAEPAEPGVPTVLVVDDDESIREVVRLALEVFAGWSVVTADGGEAAIELACARPLDAVLLDVMMPGLDGLATFARLQADPRTEQLPVVLLTAKAQVGPRQPWDDLAVHGVIAKPFSVQQLAGDVASLLGWSAPRA